MTFEDVDKHLNNVLDGYLEATRLAQESRAKADYAMQKVLEAEALVAECKAYAEKFRRKGLLFT